MEIKFVSAVEISFMWIEFLYGFNLSFLGRKMEEKTPWKHFTRTLIDVTQVSYEKLILLIVPLRSFSNVTQILSLQGFEVQ